MSEAKPLKKSLGVWAPDLDDETITELVKFAQEGNIPATLDLIMHNQSVIFERLKNLIEEAEARGFKKGALTDTKA